MQTISIRGILDDLENGLTRTTSSQGYDASVGSIESKYNLSKADVKTMFEHPLLKNRKTRKAPAFRLIDDVTPAETPTPVEAPAEVEVSLEVSSNTQEEQPVESVPATTGSIYGRRPGTKITEEVPAPTQEANVAVASDSAQF